MKKLKITKKTPQQRYKYYLGKLKRQKKEGKVSRPYRKEVYDILRNPKNLNEVTTKDVNKLKYLANPSERLKKKQKGKEQKIQRLKIELAKEKAKLKKTELRKQARNRLIGKPKSANELGENYFKKINFMDIYQI